MKRLLAFVLGALVLSACDPLQDRKFRTEGPGIGLYSSDVAAATRLLKNYLDLLCMQADITDFGDTPQACPTKSLTDGQWRVVVHTGFNDIDRRCDDYLRWLDEKRSEKEFVSDGLTNLGTLVTGILDLAAPQTRAISYLALSLGFTQSVYSSYHNLIVLGLESSTIKEIVYSRRLKFRQEFRNQERWSKPDAVYVLKAYLRICTPQEIVLDVNTYSRAVAAGEFSPLESNIADQKRAVTGRPLSASDSILEGEVRPPVDPGTDDEYEGFAIGTFKKKDMLAFQAATCVEVDGDLGPESRSALKVYEQHTYGAASPRPAQFNGKLDVSIELGQLTSGPTQACDRTRYGNYFEARWFGERAGHLRAFLARLNAAFPTNPVPTDASLNDPDVREKIRAARVELGLETGYPLLDEQVTRALLEHVHARARGRTYDGPIRGITAG